MKNLLITVHSKTNGNEANIFCNIVECCIIMLRVQYNCLRSAHSGLVIPTYITFNELEKILQQREFVDPVNRRPQHWEIKCMQCVELHEGYTDNWWRDHIELDNYSHIVICLAYPATID